jgi:phage terminase large subunit-like protein
MTAQPFTVRHFETWSHELILDSGDAWKPEDFQLAFVDDLFGGRQENWFICPEGQGKTTLVGGIVLYHCEFRRAAWVPVAASSRDQAEVLYQQSAGFVDRTERLSRIFECFDGYRRIDNGAMRSRIKIFAADAKTADGIIPTLAVVEELHRHKDLNLYRTWVGKCRKRKGAQVATISTAGEPYSDFEETRERIRQLPGATRRGSFVRAASAQIVIHDWAVPPKADVTDMRTVKDANPFSGVTLETLRADFESPTMTLAHWSRFKCNVPTRAVRSAITDIEWGRALSTERIPLGTHVALGLDVAWKWDTCAMLPLWARERSFRLLGPATILTPPRDGTSIPVGDVHGALLAIHERTPIDTVVMDITRAEETAQWIQDELGAEVIEWSQSNESAIIEYEKFMTGLRTGWLWHSGDRGLTRHVMNAIARMLPNGKTRFDRTSSTRQGGDQEARVIDALVAAAMVNAKVAELFGDEQAKHWGVM